MKTHQEIREAIDLWAAGSTALHLSKLLHAMNDRIEALKTYCEERECDTKIITANIGSDLSKLEKVVTGLCDIHP